ncbi:MAG: hypothetical protein ACRDZX_03140 [Acidimicrobiales bacterium]
MALRRVPGLGPAVAQGRGGRMERAVGGGHRALLPWLAVGAALVAIAAGTIALSWAAVPAGALGTASRTGGSPSRPSPATAASTTSSTASGATTSTTVTVTTGSATTGSATTGSASPTTTSSTAPVTPTPPSPPTTAPGTRVGYWLVRANGKVKSLGVPSHGDLSKVSLHQKLVGGAAVPGAGGYWLVSSTGGVYEFGDARFYGSAGLLALGRPIVAMAATPDGGGYWLVASDGGIFAYGDARYYGSTGAMHLNKPIVGIASTPDGDGYWLVTSDGGIFAYGDAGYFGSAGGQKLAGPVTGMAATPDGRGYWLVDAKGAVFAYGDAPNRGHASSSPVSPAVVAVLVAAYTPSTAPPASIPPTSTVPPTAPRTTTTTRPERTTTTTKPRRTTTTRPKPTTTTTKPRPTTTTTRPKPTTTTKPAPRPTPTTAPPGTSPSHPYGAGATGYDVSWPQCYPKGSGRTQVLPRDPSFVVVGVNSGVIHGFDSCFDALAAWAGRNLSVYMILQPAPSNSPPKEMTGPRAYCARTSSQCQGYNWGYNWARADLAFVKAHRRDPKVWWLDIETAEGWPTSKRLQSVNAQIIQGAIDALRGASKVAGVYSTWYQWGEITGSYIPPGHIPIWVAGALTLNGKQFSAKAYCQRALYPGDPANYRSSSLGFAGGVPWLSQYGYSNAEVHPVDPDYACG